MPTARWSDIWPRARGSCECFLLRGSRLSFEWSTDCAANTRQSSGGEQLLFLLAPRQEGREVSAETRVSSVVLPAGNSARLRAQLQLGRLGEGCCGPGLPVPAAGRNLGQFSCFFLWLTSQTGDQEHRISFQGWELFLSNAGCQCCFVSSISRARVIYLERKCLGMQTHLFFLFVPVSYQVSPALCSGPGGPAPSQKWKGNRLSFRGGGGVWC